MKKILLSLLIITTIFCCSCGSSEPDISRDRNPAAEKPKKINKDNVIMKLTTYDGRVFTFYHKTCYSANTGYFYFYDKNDIKTYISGNYILEPCYTCEEPK